ncbi:MAG: hypothetical protein A4E57_02163 [Syntrophorhabdaceae bacterium PtaU1.Bin034]|jgi:hypothetical protein|nr:MAG: hypothetical protein A4E57_02163 [Syntrophorhabdaceae bacterium PtaU1.Bin034]
MRETKRTTVKNGKETGGDMDRALSREMLEFLGERLPELKWLQAASPDTSERL